MIAQLAADLQFKKSILSKKESLHQHFDLIELSLQAETRDEPIFAVSSQVIRKQFQLLRNSLPNVTHHYAIKALPLEEVVEILRQEGAGFDLASIGEIEMVRKLGVDPSRCIFTHPFKTIKDIEYAIDFGITTFVVDSEMELKKMEPYKEKVKLFIRFSFPNTAARCDLSSKFGIAPKKGLYLVLLAKNLGLNIIGVSFHVGSQTESPEPFLKALETCKLFYKQVKKYNIHFDTINIGGGFPVNYHQQPIEAKKFFAPIHEYLQLHFSEYKIIAEPGRFIAAHSAILLCKVIGKSYREDWPCYYLNDGVYGNFSGILFDKANYPIFTLSELCDEVHQTYPCTLFGPTCDSIDIVTPHITLPELELNDILVATDIGAYSMAASTKFNSLGNTHFIVK
ncbi:MAG: type III PLP-dependent enzyme [Chitinophagaceae bacterium]|nr:type III PLP-dependent enzyme [Chitinophagaceae bacterium]